MSIEQVKMPAEVRLELELELGLGVPNVTGFSAKQPWVALTLVFNLNMNKITISTAQLRQTNRYPQKHPPELGLGSFGLLSFLFLFLSFKRRPS